MFPDARQTRVKTATTRLTPRVAEGIFASHDKFPTEFDANGNTSVSLSASRPIRDCEDLLNGALTDAQRIASRSASTTNEVATMPRNPGSVLAPVDPSGTATLQATLETHELAEEADIANSRSTLRDSRASSAVASASAASQTPAQNCLIVPQPTETTGYNNELPSKNIPSNTHKRTSFHCVSKKAEEATACENVFASHDSIARPALPKPLATSDAISAAPESPGSAANHVAACNATVSRNTVALATRKLTGEAVIERRWSLLAAKCLIDVGRKCQGEAATCEVAAPCRRRSESSARNLLDGCQPGRLANLPSAIFSSTVGDDDAQIELALPNAVLADVETRAPYISDDGDAIDKKVLTDEAVLDTSCKGIAGVCVRVAKCSPTL